ncbi:MAG: hypothetical protein QG608_3001 [Actinomycetota bacterium]|jgi:hypothetical protein|nr:hypothetical protein [Actinomycetota bacterium]
MPRGRKRLDRSELICRIRALMADRPARTAPPLQRAEWLERKARVYDDVARVDRAVSREARILAAKARLEASVLRAGDAL